MKTMMDRVAGATQGAGPLLPQQAGETVTRLHLLRCSMPAGRLENTRNAASIGRALGRGPVVPQHRTVEMATQTHEPAGAGMANFDEGAMQVTRRHSFGAGAAALVLASMLAIAALAAFAMGVTIPSFQGTSDEISPLTAEKLRGSKPVEASTTPDAEPSSLAAYERTRQDATDEAFRELDLQSIPAMRAFMVRYKGDSYAATSGYLEKVRTALEAAVAQADEAARVAEEQEQEEELRRKAEQQSVPWDMEAEPQAGAN